MDNHILLIHMGRHKTGTTALQSFLYANRKRLEQCGWCYPDIKEELQDVEMWPMDVKTAKNGARFFTVKKIRYKDETLQKRGRLVIGGEQWEKIWKVLLTHLSDKNVIISEEALWFHADEFLVGAKKKYNNIKVVVYLRRQDRAMESWWNQMVKGGRCCDKTFREYLDADEENEIAEGFHYLEKIRQISRIIGKENLIVRVYEPQQLKGDQKIASDFMDVLDIVPDWKVWEKGAMENARLSGNYIEIKRVFNSVRRAGYLKVADWAYLFERLSPQLYKAENGYFTLEERKAFLGQYAAENEQIARDYLHREDGRLFYDMEMDFPLEDIHECNSFEEDLIRTFSAIICEQHDEINQLRKRNNVLTWKLMLQNVGERKVLFFGAGQKCRELLADVPCSVELIADNDIKKSGSIGGVNIVYTRGIRDWKSYFVVVTCMETGGIEEQLQKSGMEKDKDYVLAKEYYGWQI